MSLLRKNEDFKKEGVLVLIDAANIEISSNAKLSFNVLNAFGGERKLVLDYGFLKTITHTNPQAGQAARTLQTNNCFLLEDFSTELVHDRTLNVSFADVSNVKDNVANKIELFKNTTINLEFLEEFAKVAPKKFMKKFIAIYDELPNEFKNF